MWAYKYERGIPKRMMNNSYIFQAPYSFSPLPPSPKLNPMTSPIFPKIKGSSQCCLHIIVTWCAFKKYWWAWDKLRIYQSTQISNSKDNYFSFLRQWHSPLNWSLLRCSIGVNWGSSTLTLPPLPVRLSLLNSQGVSKSPDQTLLLCLKPLSGFPVLSD